MIRIFDIHEGRIVINENCLLIPELKKIVDTYVDPIPVLGYVHFLTDPRSPYSNLPREEKEERILEDYEGDYTADDEPVYRAVEKLVSLYETPRMRLLRQAKAGLRTLGDHLEKTQIRDDDKSGNFATFNSALKSVGRIAQEYDALEKQVEEELRIRGNTATGYDEF